MPKSFILVLNLVLSLSLSLGACAPATPTAESRTLSPTEPSPAVTAAVLPSPTIAPQATPTTAMPQIGSPERPIKLVFVPIGDVERLVAGAEWIAEALHETTGLSFEVVVPMTDAVALEEMCASAEDTIGFLPALGYGVAQQLCDVKVVAKAVRSGYDWNAAMIVVARESPLQQLTDLNGKKWVYPDSISAAAYLYPRYMLKEAGVTPSESKALDSHAAVIRAIYRGEADFGTAFFEPPQIDGKPVDWEAGQNADVPTELIALCKPALEDCTLTCGNFEIRDARRTLCKELPDVAQKVRILTATPKLPNDTLAFGPAFPADRMQTILDALFALVQNNPEGFAKALETYSWTGLQPATAADYEPIRLAIQALDLRIENLSP